MKERLTRLAPYRPWVLTFLVSILIPLLVNFLSSWLELQWGILYLVTIFIVLGIGSWAIYQISEPQPILQRRAVPKQKPPRYPGLIVLVGTGRNDTKGQKPSHEVAIEYHMGAMADLVCWLITSKAAIEVAHQVKERYAARCKVLEIEVVDNEFGVQDTYDCVRRIYTKEARQHKLKPTQIIADITGGTKPMTAGMLLACQAQWPMQYMFGRPNEIVSEPVEIEFQSAEK